MLEGDPSVVLERFSRFVSKEVQPAVSDDQILYEQVGAMANSIHFLAAELQGRSPRITEQRRRLSTTLEEVERAVRASGSDGRSFLDAVENARERIGELGPDDDLYDQKRAMLEVVDDVLASADETLDGDALDAARGPLHEYLEQWTEAQLSALGQEERSSS